MSDAVPVNHETLVEERRIALQFIDNRIARARKQILTYERKRMAVVRDYDERINQLANANTDATTEGKSDG